MAWSLSFTSKMGLVKDSFHRIPLLIDIDTTSVDVCDLDKVERLVSANMKHIPVRLPSGLTGTLHRTGARCGARDGAGEGSDEQAAPSAPDAQLRPHQVSGDGETQTVSSLSTTA